MKSADSAEIHHGKRKNRTRSLHSSFSCFVISLNPTPKIGINCSAACASEELISKHVLIASFSWWWRGGVAGFIFFEKIAG